MASEWPLVRLGDISDLFDGPHQTAPLTDEGPVVYLNVGDIREGRIELRLSGRVSEETARAWSRRVVPKAGDVVFGYEATLGHAAPLSSTHRWCLGRRVGLLRPRPARVDPRFLAYSWYSPRFQETLRANRIGGSTIESIRLTDLPSWQIALPDLDEQRAIAHVVGTLDDRIELNRQTGETLQAIAEAVFRSWFVDFDPVRAKAEGRDAGMPAELAELFPDEFEDSAGEIPRGWRRAMLGDVAAQQLRAVQPKDLDPSCPYIGLEQMPRKSIGLATWETAGSVQSGKTRFRRGEILFGKLRPYFHKVGVAPTDGVCSTDIVVVAPRGDAWFGFVLGHLSSDAFVDYTSAGSTGTKMPRTSWAEMARYPVALPTDAVAAAFTARVQPMVERILAGIHENRTLVEVRDSLLPRLVSGELRVPETPTDRRQVSP